MMALRDAPQHSPSDSEVAEQTVVTLLPVITFRNWSEDHLEDGGRSAEDGIDHVSGSGSGDTDHSAIVCMFWALSRGIPASPWLS